jgi:hypothetical protein
MNDVLRSALGERDGERRSPVETLAWSLVALLGSYAVANATYPMSEYLSETFGLAETGAGARWLVRAVVGEAPLLVLLLLGVAMVAATRRRGLIASCALTVALLQGMAVALFGIPAEFSAVVEPSVPAGLVTGVVGWALGSGLSWAIDGSPNKPTALLIGKWNDREAVAEVVGGVLALFGGGFAVVRGVQLMITYLDRTVRTSDGGVLFFLELTLFDAPMVGLFLLGVAAANAVRGGGILTSCTLSTVSLLGMGFAEFGFPPKLMNVFNQAVPAGIVLGSLGWLLGVGVLRVRRSTPRQIMKSILHVYDDRLTED